MEFDVALLRREVAKSAGLHYRRSVSRQQRETRLCYAKWSERNGHQVRILS